MRIVSGKFRGKALLSPTDESIRPTADRTREAMFNILASRIGVHLDGLKVLDLFAGTGALGLEALSRGAQSAVFVDTGAEARGLIRDHIEAFGIAGIAKLLRRDATALGPAGTLGPFDLVFLDPPYGKGLGERALASLRDGQLARPERHHRPRRSQRSRRHAARRLHPRRPPRVWRRRPPLHPGSLARVRPNSRSISAFFSST